jgi:hypothetical protein
MSESRASGSVCRFVGSAIVAASMTAVGCSSSDSSTATSGTATPTDPSIAILSPTTGSCVAVGDDPNAEVPILVSTSQLALRPPVAATDDPSTSFCTGYAHCGHLVLTARTMPDIAAVPVFNNESAGPVIPLLLRKLANRYTDFFLTVAAVADDGTPIVHIDGATPVTATLKISVRAACDDAVDAGSK